MIEATTRAKQLEHWTNRLGMVESMHPFRSGIYASSWKRGEGCASDTSGAGSGGCKGCGQAHGAMHDPIGMACVVWGGREQGGAELWWW